jgi:hypothetical protein
MSGPAASPFDVSSGPTGPHAPRMSERTANCPNCGAPIRFRWAGAVQTTCEYCHSILVRHDIDFQKVGTVAELPAEGSPIQLGTEGVFDNKPFVVIGRIVYEYDQGVWNEWHLMFSDGTSGWLADAQLEYAVSFLTQRSHPLPRHVAFGQQFQWDGAVFQVTTITEANYRGVQGELPFEYWDKTRVQFADLRTSDARFATLDYSEDPPLLFMGRIAEFDELRLKNLRHIEGWD